MLIRTRCAFAAGAVLSAAVATAAVAGPAATSTFTYNGPTGAGLDVQGNWYSVRTLVSTVAVKRGEHRFTVKAVDATGRPIAVAIDLVYADGHVDSSVNCGVTQLSAALPVGVRTVSADPVAGECLSDGVPTASLPTTGTVAITLSR